MQPAALRDMQLQMAHYLRDPDNVAPPAGVEQRRLKIYQDLIYNNIEGFISGGFPVLRSLYLDADWHELVRAFIDQHRCHTPYFLEISQEFLQYLSEHHTLRECDPVFMLELAHYEWVELALDVSEETVPQAAIVEDILAAVPGLSPLAWLLSYQFPVHRVGSSFRPSEASEPSYLVVYRNRDDTVQFMELNAPTARLLALVRDNATATAAELLAGLAAELGMDPDALRAFGAEQLGQLMEESIVIVGPDGRRAGTNVAPVRVGG